MSTQGERKKRAAQLEQLKPRLGRRRAQLIDAERENVSTTLDAGRPRDCILERARRDRYDLVVMGRTVEPVAFISFAGSVTESVVRMAPCPVLTVHAAE